MFRMTMLNWHLIERKNMESKILVDTNVLLDYFLTTINEQITKIAQNHPAIVKTSSSEAPCWISR